MSGTVPIVNVVAPVAKPWPVDVATVLNSVCGYGSFAFFCLTLPLFLPIAFILPGGRRRWIPAAMRVAMPWVFNLTPTVTWRFDGEVAALRDARVVVSNHEGMLDIVASCGLPGTRTLLAKTWVFHAFPLGIAARAAGLYNSDVLTPEDYQEGAPLTVPDPRVGIFVFPEGSRSRTGAVQRFRPGAFVLAKHLDAAVVPVVMAGSRQGIRPGSMWIHPTRIHSRVLAPMRPLADESNRQFAARVRETIVRERHRLMGDLLRQGHLDRHRRHRAHGLPGNLRRLVHDEEIAGGWRVLIDLPPQEGAWLFLGCDWSSLPLTVRMFHAATAIHLVEPDAERVQVARHLWVEAGDHIVVEVDQMHESAGITTIVCCWPVDHPAHAALARLITSEVARVLLREPCNPPIGFVGVPCGQHGWTMFSRPVSGA